MGRPTRGHQGTSDPAGGAWLLPGGKVGVPVGPRLFSPDCPPPEPLQKCLLFSPTSLILSRWAQHAFIYFNSGAFLNPKYTRPVLEVREVAGGSGATKTRRLGGVKSRVTWSESSRVRVQIPVCPAPKALIPRMDCWWVRWGDGRMDQWINRQVNE